MVLHCVIWYYTVLYGITLCYMVLHCVIWYYTVLFLTLQLLDVGCAECKFVKRAIQIPFLERIAGLDVDRDLVASASGA